MGQGFPSQRLGINLSAGTGLAQTGTAVLSNSNGVSFGMQASASSLIITASIAAIGGIAAGTQTATGGTVVLSNSNGVSFGMSNSSVITASISLTTTPAAIAAGTQTGSTGTFVFANSNGLSFGMSGSSQITASISLTTTPAAIAAGTQTGSTGTFVFANSNGLSFGMSGSSQITAQMPTARFFAPRHDIDGVNSMVPSSGTTNLSLQRISIPFNLSATEADVLGALTVAGSTAGSFTLSIAAYTFAGSTASSASSTSIAYTFNSGTSAAASIYGGNSGTRWRSIPLATWNFTPGGDYLIAIMGSLNGPAGTTGSMTLYGRSGQSVVAAIGSGNYSNYFFDGIFSAGTGAFPASIHLSAINQTGASVLAQPHFRLIGTGP